LGDRCGGNFTYTQEGIKDCSACLRPHKRENYNAIQKQMGAVLELAKKKP
jgi:Zn-finger protein